MSFLGQRTTHHQEGNSPDQKDSRPVFTTPPKRGRGRPRGGGRGGKTAHQRDRSPAAPEAAQNQPDPPQSPDRPTPRDTGIQPPADSRPADSQAAAIQAIADQLARMQQDAKAFQEAAARDREADRQEMLRRTAAPPPVAGPSRQEPPQPRLPYPPADFRAPTRQPPPYPTQGYSASSIATQRPPVPPTVQPSRPAGADLLPEGAEC